MYLSDEELKKLEHLAMLRLEGGSREKLRIQLNRIIEFVGILQKVDTSGIDPAADTAVPVSSLRGDEPGDCLSREEVLGQAPACRGGLFEVPPVIRK